MLRVWLTHCVSEWVTAQRPEQNPHHYIQPPDFIPNSVIFTSQHTIQPINSPESVSLWHARSLTVSVNSQQPWPDVRLRTFLDLEVTLILLLQLQVSKLTT